MQPRKTDLTAEAVRSILDYDATLGVLRWKPNPNRLPRWNTKHACKTAGYVSPLGYVQVRIEGSLYSAHRLIWLIVYGEWPEEIDHISGDPTDNRIGNLRACTHAENSCNRKKQSNNTNGFAGVRFRPHHGKWEGRINRGGKTVWRAYFDSAQEAAAARRVALAEFHGDFARHHDLPSALDLG